jgi:excisionase family DNA binding protein
MNKQSYSTEDLSVLLKVGKSTIKRWTDEGKLHCFRTPGGHRKFTPLDVQQFVRHYNYEIVQTNGVFTPVAEERATQTPSILDIYQEKKNRIFSSSIAGDTGEITECLSDANRRSIPLAGIFDHVLLPSLYLLNDRFSSGQISSVEIQIAKTTIFSALVHFETMIKKPDGTAVEVYCITTSDGMNMIELKALQLLLQSEGCKVFNLGSALSMFSSRELVAKCKPDDVFLVSSYTPIDEHFSTQFTELKNGVEAYGGKLTVTSFSTDTGNIAFLMKESPSLEKSFSDIVRHLGAYAPRSTAPELNVVEIK